ncbi:MAG: SNF2-related protein [Thermoguttaceae bacterium]|jgi:superfamily II DNA or RNA helicase
MSLADRCIHEFDSGVRSRGEQYFRETRVSPGARGPSDFRAYVHGGSDYEVVLDWEFSREQLAVCCTCPYYDEHATCKHIWATILAADAANIGPRGKSRLGVLPMDPEDYDDDDDGSWIDVYGDLPAVPRAKAGNRSSANKISGRREPPPKPKWQQQLTWAAGDIVSENPVRAIVRPLPKAREIWYVLHEATSGDGGKLVLFFFQRETKANGQFGKLKQLNVRPQEVSRLVGAEDAEILNLLLGYHDVESHDSYYFYASSRVTEAVLSKNMQQFLLPKLAATHRLARVEKDAFYQPEFHQLQPLAWDDGPPWRFRLDIQSDDTRQCWTLTGQLYRPQSDETLPVQAPRTIFKQGLVLFEDRIAPLEASGSARMIEALRKTPKVEVPYSDRWELLRRLWQLPSSLEMNVPDNLRAEEVQLVPQGRLMIDKPERYDPYRLPGRVDFLYDGKPVSAQETARGIVDDEKGRILVRDRQRERELAASLAPRGIRPMEGWQAEKYSIWLPSQKLPDAVEALVAEGWIVEAQGYYVRRAGTWQMSVTSGVDWFDLSGTLDFEGMEVHLPEILEALRHGQNYVRLKDGSRGLLPQQWLARFATMAELGEAEGESIRFRSSQAMLLDALLAAQEQVTIDAPFAQLREKLRSFNGVGPVGEPQGFIGELRPYQKTGLGWLRFLQDFRLGGCLADDMGLGKTIQVLAMLQQRRSRAADANGRRAPSLAVVPRSLVFNWIEEAKRFTPELQVLDYTGLQRGSLADSFDQYDLVITTYGTMQRDIVKLKDLRFDYAILDESQAIKNAQSQRAKACRLLKADHRLAMTGTPVENHLGELWSLLEFLNPRMLGTASVFQDISKKVSEDNEGLSLLRRALGPFILRRTKQQVLTELPQKTEQTLHCDLEGKQRKRYDELRTYYRAALTERIAKTGMAKAKIHVLEALLRLRQVALHPGLLDKNAVDESSAKLDVLMEQLREIIDEGHKALVFSQFTSFLSIVRNRLDQENFIYEYLDGRTRQRQQHVERFQNDASCPLFLISLKAGGHGLNLTAADYVFILDPWWNPAVEAQAIDRAHRIGQERHVFAYRLIARDTVEEKIVELQRTKRDLADAIISADGNVLSRLTAEDLELLLS